MDRFIENKQTKMIHTHSNLKSNMDRFIALYAKPTAKR